MPQSQRLLKPVPKIASNPLFLGTNVTSLWLRPDGDTVSAGGSRTQTASDKSSFVGATAMTTRGTQDFWLSFAIKPTAVSTTQYIYWDGGDLGCPGIQVYLDSATLTVKVTDGTDILTKTLTDFATAGAWTFGALTFDRSGDLTIYKNGTAAATLDISSFVAADLTHLGAVSPTVGSYSENLSYQFGGSFAQIYYGEGYCPTSTDVTFLFNSYDGRTYAEIDEYGGSLLASMTSDATKTGFAYQCNETDPTSGLIDQAGTLDLTRTAAELLSNTGFETRAGITGISLIGTDKSCLSIADGSQTGLDPLTGDFSLVCMFKLASLPAVAAILYDKFASGVGYSAYITSAGKVVLQFGDGTTVSNESTSTVTTGVWYSCIATYDRDGYAKLYIGAASITEYCSLDISTKAGSINSTGGFGIGCYAIPIAYGFTGYMAMVGYADELLTEADRTEYHNSRLGKYYNELSAGLKAKFVSFWDLTDGPYTATQTANDFVGSNDLSFSAAELVTDGGFDDPTKWTISGDWSIASSKLTGTAVNGSLCYQVFPGTFGRSYTSQYTTSSVTGGAVQIGVGDGQWGAWRSTDDTWTETTVYGSSTYLYFRPSVFTGSVDTVSVKAASIPLVSDADLFGSWTESTASGDSQVAVETVNRQAGALSCRLGENASGTAASVSQTILTVGNLYDYSLQSKGSAASKTYKVYAGTAEASETADNPAFGEESGQLTCAGTGVFKIETDSATSASIYLDTVSVKSASVAVGNGPAEAIAEDSVGTNHGTLTGFSVTDLIKAWKTDGDNYALYFDGAANYIVLASAITTGTTWSFSAKINIASAPVDRACLFGTTDGSAGLFLNDDRKLNLYYGGDKLSTTALTLNTDYYIGVSVTAGNATFYVNGVADGTATGITSIAVARIAGDAASQFLNATLNDVRYYGATALSAAQFAQLHSMDEDENSYGTGTGTAIVEISGLVAQWKFNDGPFGQPTDGDAIINWKSKEGDLRLLQQTTAGSRPIYHLNEVNGHPAVYFNGTSHFMSLASAILAGTEGTVAFVVKFADPTSCCLLSSADIATATKYVDLGTNAADQMQVDQDETDVNTTIKGGTTLLTTAWHVLFYESNGVAYFLAIDDEDETLTADSGLNNGDWWEDSTGKDNTVIGALITSGGTSRYFEGYLADIVVYNKLLTVAERTNLYKNYFKPRYAL